MGKGRRDGTNVEREGEGESERGVHESANDSYNQGQGRARSRNHSPPHTHAYTGQSSELDGLCPSSGHRRTLQVVVM